MRNYLIIFLTSLTITACTHTADITMQDTTRLKELASSAPIADKIPYSAEYHGQTLSDSYFWLKDQGYPKVDDQQVLDYLVAENAYFKKFLDPHKSLVDTVFEEFKGRTDEEETSVPYVLNGYEYRWYYRSGEEYRTRNRKNLITGEETVFLDETKLSKGHKYFVLGDWDISSDNRYLAYSFDTAGDERYQVNIKDMQTGEMLTDVLRDVEGDVAFNEQGNALLYAMLEKDKWHAKHIKAHKIGSEQSQDQTIYYEADDAFFIGFGETSSKKYFVIISGQGEVQESYVIPASDVYAKPIKLVSREANFTQATIDHAHGNFYILANDTHKNFRLVKVADSDPAYENWQTVEEGSDDAYLLGLQTFNDFIAIKARDKGLENIRVRDYQGDEHQVIFPEAVFAASIGNNPEFNQSFLRLNYESMITPDTVFDYQLENKLLTTRKVQKIPSGYDKAQYLTERIMVKARDGVKVPVSIVYKKGYKKDASHPMMLYGYGAYSSTVTPRFSSARLSLLDRGFAYAIAHIRGGSMMGYQWYLDGKLEKRTNTFNDFVDVARHLNTENYVAAGNISIAGRSAGGELMGAVVIQAPELWRSVTLGVPFVDVLNTMLDESLPLTPPEWTEWGNPIVSADAYDLIKSYSPYDNIQARDYPPMLVTGGLNDPRVTYWEPAKWTAKMRSSKTDDNLLIMRINMGAGHFANSGRYGRLKDYAEEYAFLLTAHGINE